MSPRKPPGMPAETFAEQQIREAQQEGKFDNLPGFGQPIADIDEPYDELWWVKKKIKEERLSVLPPALEIRLDVERTLQQLGQLRSEAEVRSAIAQLNQRIQAANLAAVWGPPCTTMPLDAERVVQQWRAK